MYTVGVCVDSASSCSTWIFGKRFEIITSFCSHTHPSTTHKHASEQPIKMGKQRRACLSVALWCTVCSVTGFVSLGGLVGQVRGSFAAGRAVVRHTAPSIAAGWSPCSTSSSRKRPLSMQTSGATGGGSQALNPELFTEKAWEAITRLPQLADENGAQMVESELLLKSLLNEGPQVQYRHIVCVTTNC
jgi:hypothetical protein